MLPEGTKTCKICGHVLWRDEEKDVCESCKHDLRDLIEQKPRRWMVRYYDMYPLDPRVVLIDDPRWAATLNEMSTAPSTTAAPVTVATTQHS